MKSFCIRKFNPLVYLILLLIFCNCRTDDCDSRLESFGPPRLVPSEIDAWITSETIGDISFVNRFGDSLVINLKIDDEPLIDGICSQILAERNRFTYGINNDYFIIAQESDIEFTVRTTEFLNSNINELSGAVNKNQSFSGDAYFLDEHTVNNQEYLNVLILSSNSPNQFIVDSVIVEKGKGLVAFAYQSVHWIRK